MNKFNKILITAFISISFFAAHASEEQVRRETEQKLARAATRMAQEAAAANSMEETELAAACLQPQVDASSNSAMNTANDNGMNTSGDKSSSLSNQQDQKQERERKAMRSQQQDLVDGCVIMYQLKPVDQTLFNGPGLPEDLQQEVFEYLQEMQPKTKIQSDHPLKCAIMHTNKDGRELILGDSEGNIRIVGKNNRVYTPEYAIIHLATYDHANGNWYIVAAHKDATLTVLDGKTGAVHRRIELDQDTLISKIATHSGLDGAWYIICLQEDERGGDDARIFNGDTGAEISELTHDDATRDFTVQDFADGSWVIITATDATDGGNEHRVEIGIWDGTTRECLRRIVPEGNCNVSKIASYVDHNNNWFVIAAMHDNRELDGEVPVIYIYDGKTGNYIGYVDGGHGGRIDKIFTHTDSQGNWYIISASSEDKSIGVANGVTGEIFRSFEGKRGDVISYIDANNIWYIAYGDRDGFSIWDVALNQRVQSVSRVFPNIVDEDGGYKPNWISNLFFMSPTADNNISIVSMERSRAGGIGLFKSVYGPGLFERVKIAFENEVAFHTQKDATGLTGRQKQLRGISQQALETSIKSLLARKRILQDNLEELLFENKRRANVASSSSSSSQQPQARAQLQAPAQQQPTANGSSSSSSSALGHGVKRKLGDDNVDDGQNPSKRLKRDEPNNGSGSASASSSSNSNMSAQ